MATDSPWTAPLQAFLGAAQSLPGFSSSQQGHNIGYASLPDQGVPLCYPAPAYASHFYEPKLQPKHEADIHRFTKLRRWVKVIVTISHVCSCSFSLVMEVAMCYMVYKFRGTKDDPAYGRSSPWAKHTKLWPTIMLLAASGATVLLSFATLVAFYRLSKKKNTMFSILYNLIHIGAWVVVAVLYRVGKTGEDLWGWSCSSKAEKIQSLYKDKLDFSALCETQTASWHVSMVEVGVKIVFSGLSYLLAQKQNGVRAKIASSVGDEAFDQFDF
ncbi:hypothetical protein LTR70_007106 [Exophiala xenobiotica]|uniref:Uncharacterized protein n=1 Tax=Lithohypha guttulata TaxID=1690604 RepID=A0ABR0K759_9EURO|nr:hypothetical protein LTR24_006303 [Lithohypha guttulata]KAK5314477.1 hypothetical protein LTR70_007106 [Exophiala xenobiotica]